LTVPRLFMQTGIDSVHSAIEGEKMKKYFLAAAALLTVASLSSAAFAQDPDGPPPSHHRMGHQDGPPQQHDGPPQQQMTGPHDGPPPQVFEHHGPPPQDGYVWVDGYQRWDGGHYVWTPGRWDRPPHPHAHWVAHQWVHKHGAWVMVEGHWR
jgi:hypothetical protein